MSAFRFVRHLMVFVVFFACLASCADDDDDDDSGSAGTTDDDTATDDDASIDDDTYPCPNDDACSADQVCRDGACRDPIYPAINPIAYRQVTADDPDENMIVNGRLIRPAGESVLLGTFPTRMAVHPSGNVIAVNENGFGTVTDPDDWEDKRHLLRILDSETLDVLRTVPMPGRSMYIGLRYSSDGGLLYVSGGQDESVHVFDSTNPTDPEFERSIATPGCYSADLAIDESENILYVSCDPTSQIMTVDLDTDLVVDTRAMGLRPYMLALSPDGSRLFVGNWASIHQKTVGDPVHVIDTASGELIESVHVGLGPEGMVFSADGQSLYVVCNRSDEVAEIDVATLQVIRTIPLYEGAGNLTGLSPTFAALSPDGDTLYVSGAGDNAIVQVDLPSGEVAGRIPTEWYPLDVAISPDGESIYVLNGKGRGDGPTEYEGEGFPSENRDQIGRQLFGSIFQIPVPDASTLAEYTQAVRDNNTRQSLYFDFSNGNDTPVPSPGEPRESPIKYVFLILKENFSFDCAYGDFEPVNGRADYTLWDETIVPNQRRLAREFTILDNFYADAESSVDGHQWAAAGIEPDFMEKSWVLNYAGYGLPSSVTSLSPGAMPESLLFLPHLIENGLFVRAYGGFDNFGLQSVNRYRRNIALWYPQFITQNFKDEDRARIFIKEFESRVESGTVPTLSYIYLPNNHAFGLSIGALTPQSWIADNDVAVGMVVDAISRSPVWHQSLIIVFEDDSQHGFDHVDQHRSPVLAIGPWVKRGYVSSVAYSMPNIHKTVELILGVDPMHRFDGLATGMYDLFVARKDTTPFDHVERQYPDTVFEGPKSALTDLSSQLDWADIDRNPRAAELFWRYVRGTDPPTRKATFRVVDDD
ncbi:MAG: bifunctional YncE family protein/alkaline phosphatase family protein [Deltaproteobacteria bacterium]|nr:bifunctional YncE family protein/alkaline phosphatase family protein [Deltaproteobacteria bacterium]